MEARLPVFVDLAKIRVKGGAGGAGAVAFRRESGVPKGGPSGGNGGKGGDVILVADPALDTLLDYSYRENYAAGRAGHGEGSNRTGKSGEDLRLPVPLGTVVRDADSGERIGELLAAGQELTVARGGKGGRGNASYATSTHQAPREWQPGEWGEERRIELELKLIADVGLVGEPNAGKSTLLASVSAARPKVAEYPFTTLQPNLGVVGLSGGRSFVIADIPGIIEGAAEGKGLGTRFLRHIERTRTLLLLVPLDAPDPQATYDLLRAELVEHDATLERIPHAVMLSKSDLVPEGDPVPSIEAPEAWGVYVASSVTRSGIPELVEGLWKEVDRVRKLESDGAGGEGGNDTDAFPELEEWRP
ncbi:MAG: GTPase ObgE [marine benthic group bacterium]|nr:GTPase ObgE [Gemmatimonadota bacterium]MCL7963709.1 GTPase ObgE [Candidatus Carthagonibacter metallireducens]MCL7937892.1 GTPase ObgE [Gemmatimonadota bacterium]MCL7958486.1 GTPase ObgE [Gemmatimonadota bacterium]MCL7965191.1 GTPase ObgE [Gemmatimonadota bacterium]